MKHKLNGFIALMLLLLTQIAFAQDRTVSGTVTDKDGLPVPTANVKVKGTSTGTQTDFDGKYKIKANADQVLIFSFTGMETKEVKASSGVVNVKLGSRSSELETVIVTSLNIKREKKSIGYAISEVKAKDLEQRTEGDIARVLSGKASGVKINQASGISGSATNIVIRGLNSITGNNQPLFIVDGVPFSGDTNSVGNFLNGNSGSSRFLDLDPNNIASVNILKGYAAATLYGTDGKNGVILITTKSGALKKGAKKTEVSFSQSMFMNEIASLPEYQNKFGNGFDQAFGNFFSNWGAGFYQNGLGGYADPGSQIPADGNYLHPYSRTALASVFPQYQGVRLPWEAKPDNVKNFFRTGLVISTSVNLAGSTDDNKMAYNFNVGHLSDEGFTPGNKLSRTTFSSGGRAALSNKITVSGTMNFAKTNFLSPPVARSSGSGVGTGVGQGLSIFGDIFYTPRNVDLQNWPYQHPVDNTNLSYRQGNDILNPYWTLNNSFVKQLTHRAFGNASAQFEFNKNLNIVYRMGYDFYNERTEAGTNRGAPRGPVLGEYRTTDSNNLIWDHNFIVNGKYALTENIGFSFNTGATSRHENFDRQGLNSTGQGIYNVFRHFNFSNQSPRTASGGQIQYTQVRNIVGLYAQTEFDFKKYLYLTTAIRKDFVSNTNINSISYPSASLSFVATDAFGALKSQNGLNYLKLRAGYGTSSGFATGYPVANTLDGVARDFSDVNGVVNASQNISTVLGNPNLRPELYTENEFGVDLKLLNNRLGFNVSYYERTTKDNIVDAPISNSSGYTTTNLNLGLMEGEGLEVDMDLDIFKSQNNGFSWNINSNFTKSKMIVKDLEGKNNITIAGFTNLGNQAIVGEQLGVIVGSRVLRHENGQFLVNASGNYTAQEGNFIIGNPNPDFILNTTNTLSYKNINLSFLIGYTSGGDIFSQTISTLMGRGLTVDTEDRLGSFVLPGVQANGSTNTVQISNSEYYFNNLGFGAEELKVYDGSVIRLQEISLGYDMPKKWLDKTPFGTLGISFSGYNLYYNAFNTPKGVNFDPNIIGTGVGNGSGFDFLNGPSSKRYGVSIKATF